MSNQVSKKRKPRKRRDEVKTHHLPVGERKLNFDEVNLGYLRRDEVFVEAMRCYMCRKPICMDDCPANFDIVSMMESIRESDYQKAANLVHTFLPFPSSFCRICPAFCQELCVAGKKGDPINILAIKRFLADNFPKPGDYYKREPETGIKIAIIGSGPAGLTAAHKLAKNGHSVTVYEKHDLLGGMLALGIPEYRLPEDILQEEIRDLENFGIRFRTGVSYGSDITYDDLLDMGYRAILLAHGAHKPKWMGIPGEDKIGVIHAIDFLRDFALNEPILIGEKVIVVGGGDVAIDAVRVANRLGKDATIVYRRSLEQMPATKEEIEETMNEEIPIKYLTNPVEILGGEKVMGVKVIKMKLGEPDSSGRARPIPIEGSEYIIPADTLIMAISQEPESEYLRKDGFKLTKWNTLEIEDSYKTNKYGVFAAGDNVSGPKTAVEAVVQAKIAASSIHEFVMQFVPKQTSETHSLEEKEN